MTYTFANAANASPSIQLIVTRVFWLQISEINWNILLLKQISFEF